MRIFKKIIFIITLIYVVLTTALIAWFCVDMMTMWTLPKGQYIHSLTSPDGHYTVNFYLVEGNATNADSVRGELVNNEAIIFKTKNIYWEYRMTSAVAEWENNNVIVINGKRIDVKNEVYDWRKSPD